MTLLSYAPNCEDVPLWRALGDVGPGFYIDWTPERADGASITRAFYDRGWQGLAVRHTVEQAARLAAFRPRDTVTPVSGAEPLLRAIGGAVQFLCVDADDQEAVLRQIDLAVLRPWIVMVRAGEPGCEAMLAAADYQAVLFDGLSRFYLAAERAERATRLAAPANASDRYRRALDETGVRLAGLEAALLTADARIDGHRRRMLDAVRATGQARSDVGVMAEESKWLRGLYDEARAAEAALHAKVAWLQDQLATAREDRLSDWRACAEEAAWLRGCLADSQTREAAEHRAAAEAMGRALAAEAAAGQQRAMVDAMRSSLSWRVTAPLRRARSTMRGVTLPAVQQAPAPIPPVAPPRAAIPLELSRPDARTVAETGGAAPAHLAPEQPGVKAASIVRPLAPAQISVAPRLVQRVTTVHQFHAGSAKGDAITNSMLLIRSMLREAGFSSEIFVEHRGAGLEDELHLLQALPPDGGYVLLVHHSMGFAGFAAVLALPARKVLIYHNITPPELLRDVPRIERLARVGRDQLATWRDHVAFALADSDYNAAELEALGFPAVQTCPLLFDVAAMLRRATGVRPRDGVFTVLFVGRVTPSKAQDELIDAFALFHARFGRPCRLVLVGALDPDEHAYLGVIEQRVVAAGLEQSVQLTGLVSDEELHGWYRHAELYVSLSRHEGFGVPLVEALAHGVPVLAWPTGAVASTLAGDGVLLTSRAPEVVADAMLELAARPVDEGGGVRLAERFALDRARPILLAALAEAGAVSPREAASVVGRPAFAT